MYSLHFLIEFSCVSTPVGLIFVWHALPQYRSPVTLSRFAPSVSGVCHPKFGTSIAAKSCRAFDRDDVIRGITFDPSKVLSDKNFITARKGAFNRQRIGVVAPSVALLAIAAFGLPLASNAFTSIVEISSIAGGASASYSAWMESITDSGFYQAFSLVFLSEIGDKTFFVASLLAAKLSRFISFVGSLGALAVMTIISVVIGQVFHAVPSGIANGVPLDDVAAVFAFAYFGVKILAEAFESNDEGKSAMDEELEEAEETVEGSDTITKATAW